MPAAGVMGQPAGQAKPATDASGQPVPMYEINLHDEVPITQIIDLVRKDLGLQIVYSDNLADKKVIIPTAIKVPADSVLEFIQMLLEQKGFAIVRSDIGGIYTVVQLGQGTNTVPPGGLKQSHPMNATQIIETRGLKPSSLQTYAPIIGGLSNAVFSDELGIAIVTDSPAKISQLRDLIDRLVGVRDGMMFQRFEIHNIAASAARDRLLTLIGEMSAPTSTPGVPTPNIPNLGKGGNPNANAGGGAGVASAASSNLTYQLTVDPQSNTLIFRGRPDDAKYVAQLLELVDVPNQMVSQWYPVGTRAAEIIAYQGAREGLGEVQTYSGSDTGPSSGASSRPGGVPNLNLGQQLNQGSGSQQPTGNGAGFVIYPDAGGFMYHGTREQHLRVAALDKSLKELSVGDEIGIDFYKLRHAKAADVVDIINNLLSGQTGTANRGSILGDDINRGRNSQRGGNSRNNRNQRNQTGLNQPNQPNQPQRNASSTSGGGVASIEGDEDTVVIEDEKNNQVIVKTVKKMQPQFAKLIDRLDSRRPQVFINAQIVAVTGTETFRMAVETQLLAGEFGLNTNFGLGTLGASGALDNVKNVNTANQGLTAAVINSKYVPFIITALQNNTDSRVLATPQLLVDDNEPGQVSSETVIPTAVTQAQSGGLPAITSNGEPARAGTTLDVTPQISENAVKLDIEVTQSAFTGAASAPGLPPPSIENHLSGTVTVPRECTIVIGGLTIETTGNTIIKVPLLGDIPILGNAFRDTNKSTSKTTLYIFMTPTVMKDPNFDDLRLLTRGPAIKANLKSEFIMPPPMPVRMEIQDAKIPTGFEPIAGENTLHELKPTPKTKPVEGEQPSLTEPPTLTPAPMQPAPPPEKPVEKKPETPGSAPGSAPTPPARMHP